VTTLASLPLLATGKVREMYDLGDRILMVASDRISTYDVVHPTPIPDKGKVLTALSVFWFEQSESLVPNHLVSMTEDVPEEVRGRALVVRKLEMLPVECVVRGYLTGSGWKDYVATGAVCGITLPAGLRESDRLPRPIFTPATKAESGHDINISEREAADLVGRRVLDRVRELTMRLYAEGSAHAESCGIIVADTKFEFGLLPIEDGGDSRTVEDRVILIDELLTPDSSRFWPRDSYRPGGPQRSFDKQFVRDYLEQIKWNKQPPVPSLPDEVVLRTRDKYLEAFRRLTGKEVR
jgi:phosphoribosylaminoimidazole-succinocarboxamide synthase